MRFLKRWIAPIITIITVEWLLIQLLEFLVGKDDFFLNEQTLFFKSYILFSIGIVLYLLWVVILIKYDYYILKKKKLTEKLIDSININKNDSLSLILSNAYNEKRWSEVIKIGNQLSEPLWYTGKFHLRIKIGELVASAAAFENKYDIQAETLIDDLGWTNCRLNNQSEAKKNITLGHRIAKKIDNQYLIAKANRHFADISLLNKNFDECLNFLKISYSSMRLIENSTKKIEMNGNLQYTISKFYLAKKNFKKAIKAANQSQLLYKSIEDSDREVKLFNLKGKIFLSVDKEEDAISSFQEGLTLATHISNIVNIVSNSSSLAECYLRNKRYDIAKSTIEIAKQNSKAMDDPILIEKIEKLSKEIDEKLQSK